ncbi:hypothetical protein SAMN05216436_10112 [bacterium A37T11]|nr:hypothetical protein SAMN05216436_10112 [bacterium A37T11]
MPQTKHITHKRELLTDVAIEKDLMAFLNYFEGDTIYISITKTGKVLDVHEKGLWR